MDAALLLKVVPPICPYLPAHLKTHHLQACHCSEYAACPGISGTYTVSGGLVLGSGNSGTYTMTGIQRTYTVSGYILVLT